MKSQLGIVLYENAQPMDIIGPWEVLSFWKNVLDAPIDMHLIAEKKGRVLCDNRISLEAELDFTTSPLLDYLIIPGGRGRCREVNNSNLINFIKKQAAQCKIILSICTGMFLLNAAGLLKNKSVTTYWRAFPELKSFSDVKVEEARIVKDGNIWTSGGVSSGIDLALALIAQEAGDDAGKVQLLFEYFPEGTIYCSLDMADHLPPYSPDKKNISSESLPKYIKKSIRKG